MRTTVFKCDIFLLDLILLKAAKVILNSEKKEIKILGLDSYGRLFVSKL